MREEFLLKVLEYGKIPDWEAFKAISEALGLEFYHEPPSPLYTLSSESFLLDISSNSCTVIFVEEELNSGLGYIQKYLNHFLPRKHIFYCILRFLARRNEHPTKAKPDCSTHKVFCNCILRGDYCINLDLSQAKKNSFNVFTHANFNPSNVEGHSEDIFAYVCNKNPPSNLADVFTLDQFSLKQAGQGNLYYQQDNIRVTKKSVFIDGERSQVASFAFSKGLSLKDSIDVATKVFK